MKSKSYFIGALSIALLLPIIFGYIYFKDLYKNINENKKIANTYNHPEIIYTQDEKISKIENVIIDDSNYLNSATYEFEVTYTKGQYSLSTYSIYLTEINLSQEIDKSNIRWKLLILDYNTNEYKEINSGSLENMKNKSIMIGDTIQIGLNNIHRYKLHYFFAANENQNDLNISNCKFEAKIKID